MVDFGDILDSWEKETSRPYGKKRIKKDQQCNKVGDAPAAGRDDADLPKVHPMDAWMRRHDIVDKDAVLDGGHEPPSAAERRRKLHAMKPEAVIDLHGLTREESWSRLNAFFADCRRRGLQKVLIIHGKGTHSGDAPVLKKTVTLFLEKHPHAGESGSAAKELGGSGATWVILK